MFEKGSKDVKPGCGAPSLKQRLQFPKKLPIRAVLDTDTYNEVDDQFALAYMMLSPETYDVRGIYAAPFYNKRSDSPGHGMELSYGEILHVLGDMGINPDGLVYKGSDRILTSVDDPVDSPAARHMIDEAMRCTPEDPLYIIAIGAITNVASALLLEPKIRDRVVVVWLGGHRLQVEKERSLDFNTMGDLVGADFVYECGIPLIQISCWGVTSHLTTTVPELEAYLKGKNKICDELIETFKAYVPDHYGWAKELWDVGAVAYFVNPGWFDMDLIPAHTVEVDGLHDYEGSDPDRHLMLTTRFLDRTEIFRDMFKKLAAAK